MFNMLNFQKQIFSNTYEKNINGFYNGHEIRDFTDEIYCPRCSGIRKIKIKNLYKNFGFQGIGYTQPTEHELSTKVVSLLIPSLWIGNCLQYNTKFTISVCQGAKDTNVIIIPDCDGGLSTSNTPSNVSYYLDQAHRSKSIGANSAAMSMYRSALENILYEQGYNTGMLGAKIGQLERDIANNIAPEWTKDIDEEFLKHIKNIGNGSIHPNDGDITKQTEIDSDLLNITDEIFSHILYIIYDGPEIKRKNMNNLRDKSSKFR